jgi:hypothetical protein
MVCTGGERITLRYMEMADGTVWTYREIVPAEGSTPIATEGWRNNLGEEVQGPSVVPDLDRSQFSRCPHNFRAMCLNS